MAHVEVCGVKNDPNDDAEIIWTSHDEAQAYAVYINDNFEITWLADFALYEDASEWATEVALTLNLRIEDHTYDIH